LSRFGFWGVRVRVGDADEENETAERIGKVDSFGEFA